MLPAASSRSLESYSRTRSSKRHRSPSPFSRTTTNDEDHAGQVVEYARTRSTIATMRSPFGPRSVPANANGRYRGRPVDNRCAITSRCKHAAEIRLEYFSCTLCTLRRPSPALHPGIRPSRSEVRKIAAGGGAILSFEYHGKSVIGFANSVAFELSISKGEIAPSSRRFGNYVGSFVQRRFPPSI